MFPSVFNLQKSYIYQILTSVVEKVPNLIKKTKEKRKKEEHLLVKQEHRQAHKNWCVEERRFNLTHKSVNRQRAPVKHIFMNS